MNSNNSLNRNNSVDETLDNSTIKLVSSNVKKEVENTLEWNDKQKLWTEINWIIQDLIKKAA